ncbi:MAG: formate transporter [Proteobacteria bacterium SG_bin6]|nr:MAG: formate transporter [Proteobacteria bacterium SG_bin6]
MADDDQDQGVASKAIEPKQLHRAVRREGEDELGRPVQSLFWSGLAAGLAVSASLVAEGAFHRHAAPGPGRALIESLGYPFGFLIVVMGRMQLFTESTITAMLPLVHRPSWWALWRTARLWAVVLCANLIGTAIMSALFASGALGGAEGRDAMVAVSRVVVERSPAETLVRALPAGFLLAAIAWTLSNARQQAFLVVFAITYLVAIGEFSHSIVGSVEAFLLAWIGTITVGEAVFGFLLPAIIGNLIGGAGLFALLAHA